MKKLFTHTFLALLVFIGCNSTPIENQGKDIYIPEVINTVIGIIDSTDIYINDDGSKELFYCAVTPKEKIKGTLILLPSTYEPVEQVISNNNKLLELAYKKGVLIIVPSINYNLILDKPSLSFLNITFKNAVDRYDLNRDKIVIGGFSLGGMNAIRYTELAYESDSTTAVKPVAVYGVDPPLDWIRIYNSFVGIVKSNFSKAAVNEATDYLDKLNNQFGGTPKEVPETYARHSMYSKTEKDGGNTFFLKNVPVRIYADPDINWRLKERRQDLYDMNVLDHSAFIKQLLILGNDKAEFINAFGKGYRANGMRHPHSWTIVEPVECINWILDIID